MVTTEEVIKLWNKANNWEISGFSKTLEELTKFANEVAAAEREACADVCDHLMDTAVTKQMATAYGNAADAIRNRE